MSIFLNFILVLSKSCKLAIRESIEAEIRREKQLQDNPDAEIVNQLKTLQHC